MPIHPINSANITFGRKKREQTKSQIIPGAIVGAAAGAGFSHFNKVKMDKGNIEESIKIIETKIPKTMEQSDSFEIIKKTFTSLKEHRDSQLSKMGIEEGTKEVSTQSILNGIVDNKEEKTVERLQSEIDWVKGETTDIKDPKILAEKKAIIAEKEAMKKIVQGATDEKVSTSSVTAYYDSIIKNNPKIKQGIDEFSSIVKSFNKRRMGVISAAGLVAGAFVGNMFKTKIKPKEEEPFNV